MSTTTINANKYIQTGIEREKERSQSHVLLLQQCAHNIDWLSNEIFIVTHRAKEKRDRVWNSAGCERASEKNIYENVNIRVCSRLIDVYLLPKWMSNKRLTVCQFMCSVFVVYVHQMSANINVISRSFNVFLLRILGVDVCVCAVHDNWAILYVYEFSNFIKFFILCFQSNNSDNNNRKNWNRPSKTKTKKIRQHKCPLTVQFIRS